VSAGRYPLYFSSNCVIVDVEGISDEQILHSAVGILRRDIEKLKISVEDYPKSQSTSRFLNKFRVRLATKKRSKPGQVTTMRSDHPSACTKIIFADLYQEILTKSAVPC
jgi:hypothetical protein